MKITFQYHIQNKMSNDALDGCRNLERFVRAVYVGVIVIVVIAIIITTYKYIGEPERTNYYSNCTIIECVHTNEGMLCDIDNCELAFEPYSDATLEF